MDQLQPILLTLIVFGLNLLGKFLKEWKPCTFRTCKCRNTSGS